MKQQKYQSKTVRRVTCNKCGELLLKTYPNAMLEQAIRVACVRCTNSSLKSGVA